MRWLSVWVLLLLITGCANVSRFEPPQVNVIAVKFLPRQGFDQPILVSLRLANPNNSALPIKGLSYRLSLNGHSLVSGFRDELPVIRPRGDSFVDLEARVNLLSAAIELAQLLVEDNPRLNYQFDADFDLNGLWPNVHTRSNGVVNLQH